MKMLQILGTDCPKCKKLAEAAEEAAGSLGSEYRLESDAVIGRTGVKIKTVASVALIAFVVASVVFLVAKELGHFPSVAASSTGSTVTARAAGGETENGSSGQPLGQGSTVIAYYFHGKFRCASCVKIEALSRKAVTEGFPDELKSGRLQFREVNIDEAPNQHFIAEYRLSSQSLILVEVRDGRRIRWQKMEKVWKLLDSEREFIPYVRDEVSGFLKSS